MAAQRTDELRSEIERLKGDLSADITRLADTVADATDWRARVRQRPWAYASGAFLFGLVLGLR